MRLMDISMVRYKRMQESIVHFCTYKDEDLLPAEDLSECFCEPPAAATNATCSTDCDLQSTSPVRD